ncbi:hypothetical protein Peur_013099 [Populus x canadensis]
MLKSEASQYVEFNSVDASFVGDGNGKLWNVPDSRAAIIKDKSLTLMEKNQLMRIILYAIAMTDYDQEDMEACRDLFRTKDGMDCLALHQSPAGSCDSVKSIRSPAAENFCDTGFANAGDGDAYGKGAKDRGSYKGIRLPSDQDICSQKKLVLDPSFTLTSLSASPPHLLPESFNFLSIRDVKERWPEGYAPQEVP